MSTASDALLSQALLERHPTEAAALLDTFDGESAAAMLDDTPSGVAAEVLREMTPALAATCLSSMDPRAAGAIVALMPVDAVTMLLRRMSGVDVESLLEGLPAQQATQLRSVLEFPPRSAGAVMDPRVTTLTPNLSVAESLDRLRIFPTGADDELYVVDRDQRLLGVVPARVLVSTMPDATVRDIMRPARYQVSPRAGLDTVQTHPGWAEARTLPVVSEDKRLLGVIAFSMTHRRDGPALTEVLVGTVASLGELACIGSTLLLTSLIEVLSDRAVRPEEQIR